MTKSSKMGKALLGILLLQGSLVTASEQEKVTNLDDQTSVAVTIYNGDLALVKDQRKLVLKKGLNQLAFREVSAAMRPETALLRSASDAGSIRLLEQNFDFDLLTPRTLLAKFVGQEVGIIRTHPTTGGESREKATILSVNDGVVLRFADRIEIDSPGRIVVDQVPANLRDQPTLVMRLDNKNTTPQTLELSYLTGGLNWQADYVAELDPDDTEVDLNGWVTLTNQSGASYPNAKLQLVAGDVNRVEEDFEVKNKRLSRRSQPAEAPDVEMSEESLFEYHLYTLGFPTTLKNNQTKQVALLNASSVPVKKSMELRGSDYYYMSSYGDLGQQIKVGVYVSLKNEKEANLGKPLPKGVVRVYKRDSQGNVQFIGEDRIDHTPNKETVKLKLGDAFDVTAHKVQKNYKRVKPSGSHTYAQEIRFEITLKNAKTEPVVVDVIEPIPGYWTISKQSHKHQKAAAGTAVWEVPVPAEGEAKLTYTAKVQY